MSEREITCARLCSLRESRQKNENNKKKQLVSRANSFGNNIGHGKRGFYIHIKLWKAK